MIDRPVTTIRSSRPIVIGSGIAGLTTALSLDGATVITASKVGRGSSWLAQGGLAAAIGQDDDPRHHAFDTLRVGGAIAVPELAEALAVEAPGRVGWLESIGAEFDEGSDGALVLGREAGHSHRRIVHAGGDATGAEIMRALRTATVLRSDIEIVADTRLVDLIRNGDRIVGALVASTSGAVTAYIAPAVILATGGIGGIYARSTNPPDVMGAGIAAAARQGATLADLEFVQFHPTALATVDHPAPLLSEALRGEGATIVDESGSRFMVGAHPDAELAPRDVVSREIWVRIAAGHRVFLDTRHSIGADLASRFPTAHRIALEHGVEPSSEPIPIAPAEHFHMGGIATDAHGATSLDGLWAAGEVASTGVHGANRLASNSLLEGLVMGARVARATERHRASEPDDDLLVPRDAPWRIANADVDPSPVRTIAWRDIGIVRSRMGLEHAIEELGSIPASPSDAALVARLIAGSALSRTESRGAHHRADHPETDPSRASRSFETPTPSDLMPVESAGLVVHS